MRFLQTYGNEKWYLLIGHATFILYLVFTIIYFKERLLNCDAAYYTFHVINYEDFFVKHQRYISYFTQWAPLLVIKLGGSLKAVMLAYSGIFGIWFYAMYIVSAHAWKNIKGGLFLAMSLFLAMRYKHFAGHTEITFAIAVASLLVIWITTDKKAISWYNNWVDWFIKVLLIGWLFIIHPIIIIPLSIILAADTFYYKRWKERDHIIFLVLLLFSFIIRFLSVAGDSYESGKISILATTKEVFSSPGEYYVFNMLEEYLFNEYLPALVLFICLIIWLARKKHILTSAILFLGFMSLTILIAITYSYLRGDIYIMIDGYLGMLGMVWGFAMYLFIRSKEQQKWHIILIALLLAYSGFRTWEKKYILERRLENYTKTFDMFPDQAKLIVPLRYYDWDQFWYPYEISMETLMLSSLDSPENSRTIFIDYDDKGIDQFIQGNDFFLNFYNKSAIKNLNSKYFNLNADQPYFPVDRVSWK